MYSMRCMLLLVAFVLIDLGSGKNHFLPVVEVNTNTAAAFKGRFYLNFHSVASLASLNSSQ